MKENSVSVSVVISTYNRKNTLARVIECIQKQTVSDIEILVCDDGSTDGTCDMVNNISIVDSRVKYIYCGHNGRPAVPRNKGIETAIGKWIAFTDDDDYWLPNKLEVQLESLKSCNARMCCSDAYLLKDNVNDGVRYHKFKEDTVFELSRLLGNNYVICSSSLVDRNVLLKCGGFPEDIGLKAIEDYALWLRVACITPIFFVAEPLLEYTVNSVDSIRTVAKTSYKEQKKRVIDSLIRWLKNQSASMRLIFIKEEVRYLWRNVRNGFTRRFKKLCKLVPLEKNDNA